MLNSRIVSSLDKCFPTSAPEDFAPLSRISVLRGERLSFQYVYRNDAPDAPHRAWCAHVLEGDLAPLASVRMVECTPSLMPVYPPPRQSDDDFITKAPGLFPDRLEPPAKCGIPLCSASTRALWITVDIPAHAPAGEHILTLIIKSGGNELDRQSITVDVIAAALPKQTIKVTQWFHCDCLADYYRVPVFSEEHWRIIENFARTAVENGINTLLTPLFTPPLDTAIGSERPTVQLVGIVKDGDKYSFDYTLLDRWIDMCNRVGVEYFEINHLFTQWGAAAAPKVMATVNGEYRRIFGWDTPASQGEYPVFLRTFIPDFIAHMKARGDDRRCIFHISDEPNASNLEQYTASRAVVADLLEGYTTMDALSNVDFWKSGVIQTPVAANNHIDPFIEAGVPGLWVYYCCSQSVGTSNRFFAMPGARTRCMGLQMYKYDIAGFLQWGYNFYYNQGSYNFVDPYADSTGQFFAPSGDTYSVYPAPDGTAYESLRLVQFHEGLQDLRALELCARLYGKEATVAALEQVCGEIRFDRCICDSAKMIEVRELINDMIQKAI